MKDLKKIKKVYTNLKLKVKKFFKLIDNMNHGVLPKVSNVFVKGRMGNSKIIWYFKIKLYKYL